MSGREPTAPRMRELNEVSQVLPRRSGVLLSFEQTTLPADAPTIAGDGPVLLDDPVTWDEDRDGVRTNCLRDVAGIARSELGRQCSVTRRLSARDFAQHGPDMLLVVAAAHVEHDFRILSGVIDDAFELGDSAGQNVLVVHYGGVR